MVSQMFAKHCRRKSACGFESHLLRQIKILSCKPISTKTLDFMQILLNFLILFMQFFTNNIASPFIRSFFTVVGGTTPITILIYIFSRKERKRLLAHADEIEKSLPYLENLYKKMAELTEKSINPQNLDQNLDQFKKLVEAQDMIEQNKKFVNYAKNYDFVSAVGHVLRVSNYMPKSISEHKEISKNLPRSSSSDT